MKTQQDLPPLAQGMPYTLRPMFPQDIPQVEAIEQEAFGPWGRSDWARALRASFASNLVACRRNADNSSPYPPAPQGKRPFPWLWGQRRTSSAPSPVITGYVSTWFLGGEAHIVAIAVATPFRRQGIGELLLLGSIEEALRRRVQAVTLEVRVSNIPAQRLYEKYGFTVAGRRRGYYLDNGEDALIMTVTSPLSPAYRERFQALKDAHHQRWGVPERQGV